MQNFYHDYDDDDADDDADDDVDDDADDYADDDANDDDEDDYAEVQMSGAGAGDDGLEKYRLSKVNLKSTRLF